MDPRYHFNTHVLRELREKTRWVYEHFEDPHTIKTRRWRCPSCDQLCEYSVQRVELVNGTKAWEINVDQVFEDPVVGEKES